jgi:serine/threonine protein kinase
MKCFVCAAPLEPGRYCPSCGASVPPPAPESSDPLLGSLLADRYELIELLSVGGMGRIYRALYRALDHVVAVKVVHPHLLGLEEASARFMTEASIASRLNHPNVVAVHTYGRTAPAEGGHLFMVMELLRGPSLAAVLREQPFLPFERVADILGQVLGALSEAHLRGITHRDVKPANIILETGPNGGDLVKLIDFGIAKSQSTRRITRVGEVIGTPSYMSPELATGKDPTPAADLYAVGILLHQMLTGVVPFTGATPSDVLRQQLTAPRVDPRLTAPSRVIPGAAAAVCLRAIAVDAGDRYPDAEALAQAIHGGLTREPWVGRRSALFRTKVLRGRSRSTTAERAADTLRPPRPVDDAGAEPTLKTSLFQPGRGGELPTRSDAMPFEGRTRHVDWSLAQLAEEHVVGVALSGRPGAGRSRLLHAIATQARSADFVAVFAAAGGDVAKEISGAGLKRIVSALVGAPPDDAILVSGRAAPNDAVALGLTAIFADALPAGQTPPEAVRTALAATLAWAARGAAESATPRRVLLAIDDIDRLDHVSHNALADLLRAEPIPGLRVLATCERVPPYWTDGERLQKLRIAGLTQEEARRATAALPVPPRLGRRDADVEPLYLQQLVAWEEESEHALPAPSALVDLIEWRLRGLTAGCLRALQAVAISGGGPVRWVAQLMASPDELDAAMPTLVRGGWVGVAAAQLTLTHEIFGRVLLDMASEGALVELHARAATLLEERPSHVELRAFHAVLGRPDFGAFLLLDESVALRRMLGDEEGAIRALQTGLRAARHAVLRGDLETTSAWVVFAHNLGAALVGVERYDEALQTLTEVLPLVPPSEIRRAYVLEQMAIAAAARGRSTDAEQMRRAALKIALEGNDTLTATRLANELRSAPSGTRQVTSDPAEKRADGDDDRESGT